MPGPGGGSRGGGGFSGGGSRGGGFGGGGFGGGHHGGFHGGPRGPRRPPMHHHHWGWGWGPRRPYGGFGGGCLGILMLPIILILVAVMILVSTLGSACNSILAGGQLDYDDKTFQDYVDSQYQKVYGASSAYEDNILIVFLTDEDAEEYGYYAWVGDHIASEINLMFGYTGTEFGNAMSSCISSGYWYSLDSNLASAVTRMADQVEKTTVKSTFTCSENHIQTASKLYNYSDFTLTDSTVNTALESFTQRTGITISIVVEDMTDVLETDYSEMIGGLVIVAALVGVAIFLIVKITKNNKNNGQNNQSNQKNDYANGNFTV